MPLSQQRIWHWFCEAMKQQWTSSTQCTWNLTNAHHLLPLPTCVTIMLHSVPQFSSRKLSRMNCGTYMCEHAFYGKTISYELRQAKSQRYIMNIYAGKTRLLKKKKKKGTHNRAQTCVVLPHPVLPLTTMTLFLCTALTISLAMLAMGSCSLAANRWDKG